MAKASRKPAEFVDTAGNEIDTVNPNVVTLDKPIKRAGQTIDKVTLIEPNAGTLRGVSLAAVAQSEVDALIKVLPRMTYPALTTQELTAMKVPYEVGRAQFKHLARAQIAGMNVGSLKILFHRDTLQILGIHCFGERAAEIIHIGQAIMEQKGEGNTIEYFVNTTFNYPTMAEAYRVAALNGLNRLF